MAQVNLPMTLSVATWDKHKSALAKVANAPASKLPDELKQLTKLHLAVKWDAFAVEKDADADDVKDSTSALDTAVKGSIKTLLAQAQTVQTAATKYETDAKKDKAFPKDVLATVAAIISAAKAYRDDVDAAVEDARKALTAKSQALGAGQKKAPAAVDPKLVKLAKGRLLTAIALLAKPGGAPKPMRFMVVQGKKTTGLALAYAVGPAQEKLLKSLLPGEAPYKVMKDLKAQVVWEKKALTFVSDKLSLTVIKKIQAWLKKQFKISPKMRVRTSDGRVEETAEGDDAPDELLKASAAEGATGMTMAEVTARLTGLQGDIRQGLAGPSQAEIKALVASITALVKAGKADEADEALDEMEALLQGDAGGDDELDDGEGEDETPEADTEASPAPTTTAAPGGAGREAFTRRLTALQPKIKQALAGAAAARVKQLSDGVTQAAKAGRYDDAGKLLDAIEAALGQGTSTDAPDREQAMQAWKTGRAAAVSSLKAVAGRVAEAKHASSAKAIIELQAVIKNLTPEPADLRQVKELQRWLADDDVVTDVCELAEDIRTPLLRALTGLQAALSA